MKKLFLLIGGSALLIVSLYISLERRSPLSYEDNLDAVIATVDGKDLTLLDLSLYVIYEERAVEEDAKVYNPDNTRDYWNARVNGSFVSTTAKKTALLMAAHDRIFYDLAVEKGITLSDEDRIHLKNSIDDFWMDLLDVQKDRLPVSDEEIEAAMERMALSEKYQEWLADSNGRLYHEYDWDSYDYEMLFQAGHKVKENKAIYDRISLGNITLIHSGTNYINGKTDEELKELRDTDKTRSWIFDRSNEAKEKEKLREEKERSDYEEWEKQWEEE